MDLSLVSGLIKEQKYEVVNNWSKHAGFDGSDDSIKLLAQCIFAANHQKDFNNVIALCEKYLRLSPFKSAAYSDTFSILIDAAFKVYLKEDAITYTQKILAREDRISYHNFLYSGSLNFLKSKNYLDDIEIAGKLFRSISRRCAYTNHNLRGVQYILGKNTLNDLSRSKLKNENITINPKKNSHDIVHLISMDSKYLKRFIKYILFNHMHLKNQITLHIHIVNPEPDQLLELRKLGIAYSYNTFEAQDIIPYYISARFLILPEIFKAYPDSNFIVSDADMIFRESPVEEIKKVKDFDAAVFKTKDSLRGLYPWRSLGAGFMFLKNNRKTLTMMTLFSKAFYELYEPDRHPRMNTQWWIDQGILVSLFEYSHLLQTYNLNNSSKMKNIIFFPTTSKEAELEKIMQDILSKKGKVSAYISNFKLDLDVKKFT